MLSRTDGQWLLNKVQNLFFKCIWSFFSFVWLVLNIFFWYGNIFSFYKYLFDIEYILNILNTYSCWY